MATTDSIQRTANVNGYSTRRDLLRALALLPLAGLPAAAEPANERDAALSETYALVAEHTRLSHLPHDMNASAAVETRLKAALAPVVAELQAFVAQVKAANPHAPGSEEDEDAGYLIGGRLLDAFAAAWGESLIPNSNYQAGYPLRDAA